MNLKDELIAIVNNLVKKLKLDINSNEAMKQRLIEYKNIVENENSIPDILYQSLFMFVDKGISSNEYTETTIDKLLSNICRLNKNDILNLTKFILDSYDEKNSIWKPICEKLFMNFYTKIDEKNAEALSYIMKSKKLDKEFLNKHDLSNSLYIKNNIYMKASELVQSHIQLIKSLQVKYGDEKLMVIKTILANGNKNGIDMDSFLKDFIKSQYESGAITDIQIDELCIVLRMQISNMQLNIDQQRLVDGYKKVMGGMLNIDSAIPLDTCIEMMLYCDDISKMSYYKAVIGTLKTQEEKDRYKMYIQNNMNLWFLSLVENSDIKQKFIDKCLKNNESFAIPFDTLCIDSCCARLDSGHMYLIRFRFEKDRYLVDIINRGERGETQSIICSFEVIDKQKLSETIINIEKNMGFILNGAKVDNIPVSTLYSAYKGNKLILNGKEYNIVNTVYDVLYIGIEYLTKGVSIKNIQSSINKMIESNLPIKNDITNVGQLIKDQTKTGNCVLLAVLNEFMSLVDNKMQLPTELKIKMLEYFSNEYKNMIAISYTQSDTVEIYKKIDSSNIELLITYFIRKLSTNEYINDINNNKIVATYGFQKTLKAESFIIYNNLGTSLIIKNIINLSNNINTEIVKIANDKVSKKCNDVECNYFNVNNNGLFFDFDECKDVRKSDKEINNLYEQMVKDVKTISKEIMKLDKPTQEELFQTLTKLSNPKEVEKLITREESRTLLMNIVEKSGSPVIQKAPANDQNCKGDNIVNGKIR